MTDTNQNYMIMKILNECRTKSQLQFDQSELLNLTLNFEQFRCWLDLNKYVRTLVLNAINPLTWAVNKNNLPAEMVSKEPYIAIHPEIVKSTRVIN